MQMPPLLTITELAKNLKVTPACIYTWVKQNKIPFIKMPGSGLRFDEKKITEWLEKRTVKSKAIGTN